VLLALSVDGRALQHGKHAATLQASVQGACVAARARSSMTVEGLFNDRYFNVIAT
jgi:hypothetical protein